MFSNWAQASEYFGRGEVTADCHFNTEIGTGLSVEGLEAVNAAAYE